MLRGCCPAFQAGRFHYGDAQDVLGLPGEIDVIHFLIGDGFPREDSLVDEGFHIGRFYSQMLQRRERRILFLSDDSEEKMVRADSITAGAHGFFPRIFDDLVEFFRYFQLHRYKNNDFPFYQQLRLEFFHDKMANSCGHCFCSRYICYEEIINPCTAPLRYCRRSTRP